MKSHLPTKIVLGILFLCSSITIHAQNGLTNLSFETWTTTASDPSPLGWFSDNVTQQITGAQQGSKYARINLTGFLFLGDVNGDGLGAPISFSPTTISGFYKTSGMQPGDVMSITALTKKGNSLRSAASMTIGNNAATWTAFNVPFTVIAAGSHDTINIMISNDHGNTLGSVLDVDNLSLGSGTGTVTRISEAWVGTAFMVYPNPATDRLTIISKNELATSMIITDIFGNKVDDYFISDENTIINLNSYQQGLYFYSIVNSDGEVLLTRKFVVEK